MPALATHPDEAGPSGTRSGKSYLKNYSKSRPNESTIANEESSSKQKELRVQKGPKKDSETASASFQFDVLAQLANISACITVYELLRLSNITRDPLRDGLTDSEAFLSQITEQPYPRCHQVMK